MISLVVSSKYKVVVILFEMNYIYPFLVVELKSTRWFGFLDELWYIAMTLHLCFQFSSLCHCQFLSLSFSLSLWLHRIAFSFEYLNWNDEPPFLIEDDDDDDEKWDDDDDDDDDRSKATNGMRRGVQPVSVWLHFFLLHVYILLRIPVERRWSDRFGVRNLVVIVVVVVAISVSTIKLRCLPLPDGLTLLRDIANHNDSIGSGEWWDTLIASIRIPFTFYLYSLFLVLPFIDLFLCARTTSFILFFIF